MIKIMDLELYKADHRSDGRLDILASVFLLLQVRYLRIPTLDSVIRESCLRSCHR